LQVNGFQLRILTFSSAGPAPAGDAINGQPARLLLLGGVYARVLSGQIHGHENDEQSVSDAGKSVLDPFRSHGQLQEPGAGGIKHRISDQSPHTDYGGFSAPLRG